MFEHNKVPLKTTSFGELTRQVHLINDLILADMICDNVDESEEAITFSKHLLATKYWFARISWRNKKRYLLALLQDVRSAWTLSLLLKSMWNCRPKDAILSVSERTLYTSYDQVPMDHNRTALPVSTLAQVMKNDRIWFLSLNSESQALVLSELLTVAGGPAMWVVMNRARIIYDRYRARLLKNLQECTVVYDRDIPREKSPPEKMKKEAPGKVSVVSVAPEPASGDAQKTSNAQKMLDTNLIAWNATIKGMRDSLKLEELEMIFTDGTKRKIWKVNRPKPEITETVDFIQLLPSSIGKKILSYLPRMHLGDYARVNKYWAYLVEELRAELATRVKINADFERLHEMLLRHDTSLMLIVTHDPHGGPQSSQGIVSTAPSARMRQPLPSVKASEKSGGAYCLKTLLNQKLNRPLIAQKPIRNMKDLKERLDRRGAADENIWKWCECVLNHAKKIKKCKMRKDAEEGILSLGNVHFPCPLMKVSIDVPLTPPLYKDPIISTSAKPKKNFTDCTFVHAPKTASKRYSLWTRDLSNLYPVFKIPSYQSPI